jgi:hypothetical protein
MKRPQILPPACSRCALYGGLWAIGRRGAAERCSCDRGRILASLDRKHGTHPRRCLKLAPTDWKMRQGNDAA